MRCGIGEESHVKKRRKIRQSEQGSNHDCVVRAQVWEMRGTKRMIHVILAIGFE